MIRRRRGNRTLVLVVVAILVVLFLLFGVSLNFIVDYQWFTELGYVSVFMAKLIYRFKIAAPIFILLAMIFFIYFINIKKNFYNHSGFMESNEEKKRNNKILLTISIVLSLFLSLFISESLWLDILKYMKAVNFNITDPIFAKDISFYMFKLPLIKRLLSALLLIVAVMTVIPVLLYSSLASLKIPGRIGMQDGQEEGYKWGGLFNKKLINLVVKQTAVLGFVIFLILALKYFFNGYNLLFSPKGIAYGAGYTDIAVTLKVYMLKALVCVLSGALVIYAGFRNRYKLALGGPIALIIISIIGNLAFITVQNYIVEPNEYTKEKQYIENSIEYTRKAYGLDKIQHKEFIAADTLTPEDIQNNQQTIDNIRVNDYRPALEVYNQLQGIRPYYRFNDIDIDRYMIDGTYTQVFLSARELSPEHLRLEAQSWVNKYLRYTHGYGAVLSPVKTVTPQGQPELLIKDIPPATETGLKITQPEIYFGELTDDYIITNAKSPEFDYPMGDDNIDSFYQGTAGIKINTFNKLAFALYHGTSKILFSGDITPDSRMLIERNIISRAAKIAPYFSYDEDPYLIIHEGKLFWMIDGYTHNSDYPYSQPIGGGINYIRNSFKVVIDAYNGTTDFYLVDEDDAVALTYGKIFPDLFKSLDQMPEGIRKHIRYPETLFDIQADVFRDYHMENPQVFYNREDAWNIALEQYGNETLELDSSYQIIKLPGEEEVEFILTVSYTPINKNNMVAFLVARNDGDKYGEMIVYKLPKNKLVYGPFQIETRISQDTEIARQLSLWDQRGSEVIRGNLLTIPIEDSLLYVEPMFMKASGGNSLPEMRRVIVAYKDTIVMEETLAEALETIFGDIGREAPSTGEHETSEDKQGAREPQKSMDENLEDLVRHANELFEKAQTASQSGDWAKYGEYLKELEEALNAMQRHMIP